MYKMKINNIEVKVMREFDDEKYGHVLRVYLKDRKTYVINNSIIDNQGIIDELDNKYGIPVNAKLYV